ncbi:MAG: hypothetical protein ACLP50_11100 [Solirubrobacteraceae bacterium]
MIAATACLRTAPYYETLGQISYDLEEDTVRCQLCGAPISASSAASTSSIGASDTAFDASADVCNERILGDGGRSHVASARPCFHRR